MAQQATAKKGGFDNYVTVAERIEKFYQLYPQGRIITNIVEHDQEHGFILMRAEVYRNADDAQPAGTGHAYEVKTEGYVQRTSYIEVCETSSVGRALAIIGLETKRGIGDSEGEQRERPRSPATPQAAQPAGNVQPLKPALPNQLQWIAGKVGDIAQACEKRFQCPPEMLSFDQAKEWIAELRG